MAKPEGYAASIILGGAMSVSDAAEMDFIAEEIAWVRGHLENDAPLLGICLGAQMIACALGAKVWEHPDEGRQIGYHEVHATPAGSGVFPERLTAYQWHRESFDLPRGAELLATGPAAFYNQAFRHGSNAYGVQFHPEMIPANHGALDYFGKRRAAARSTGRTIGSATARRSTAA